MGVHDSYVTRLTDDYGVTLRAVDRVLVTDGLYFFTLAAHIAARGAQVVAVVDTTPRHVIGVSAQLAGVASVVSGDINDHAWWDQLMSAQGPFDYIVDCGNVTQANQRAGQRVADAELLTLRRPRRGGR